jgi:hypothetical protein
MNKNSKNSNKNLRSNNLIKINNLYEKDNKFNNAKEI